MLKWQKTDDDKSQYRSKEVSDVNTFLNDTAHESLAKVSVLRRQMESVAMFFIC